MSLHESGIYGLAHPVAVSHSACLQGTCCWSSAKMFLISRVQGNVHVQHHGESVNHQPCLMHYIVFRKSAIWLTTQLVEVIVVVYQGSHLYCSGSRMCADGPGTNCLKSKPCIFPSQFVDTLKLYRHSLAIFIPSLVYLVLLSVYIPHLGIILSLEALTYAEYNVFACRSPRQRQTPSIAEEDKEQFQPVHYW